nr:uncharacterized protein LOC107439135 [Parasteatoda tepidariorum]
MYLLIEIYYSLIFFQVINAKCDCAGGVELAVCKHSLALLYAIQSYSAEKLYVAPTEVLQRWHQKKPVKREPKTFFVANELLISNVSTDINFSALNAMCLNAPIFDVVNPSQCDKDDLAYSKRLPLPALVIGGMHTIIPDCAEPVQNLFMHSKVIVTLDEAIAVEKSTVKQSQSDTWSV